MTAFHSRQSDCGRRVHKKANAGTFNFTSQIAPPICTVMFTKREKSGATIFKHGAIARFSVIALMRCKPYPLSEQGFYGSPIARRKLRGVPRDGHAMAAKHPARQSGEISRVISAQLPGNGRAVATAMPPNVRQDDSQDNLPCARLGRAMSAPETCETTRSQYQPRNSQCNILQATRRNFRLQLLTMTSKNYEHTNHTNARS